CSDIDDIIVFLKTGKYVITKIQEKLFVDKNIIYCTVFRKGNERMVYNTIYTDGKTGKTYAKRFAVTSMTRDKEYDITKSTPRSKLHYFSANENGEAEVVSIFLTSSSTAKKKQLEWDFAELEIKGRGAGGNLITKYPVRRVAFKTAGKSTLGGVDIWYLPNIGRLNRDEHGDYLGNFDNGDKVMVVYKTGEYELTNFELTNHYDPRQVMLIIKYREDGIISAFYYDGESQNYYVKRFVIETSTMDKKFLFITDHNRSQLMAASCDDLPRVQLKFKEERRSAIETQEFKVEEMVDVRGWNAKGYKLNYSTVKEVKMLAPEIIEKKVVTTGNGDDEDDEEQLGLF
ncbi:MAG: topoisomerase-4 subunit A, partial [Spirosomataceae bacterium]